MRAPVLPAPGVTVLAPSYALAPGGKGANAACACAVTGRGRNRIAMTSAFVDVFDVVVKFVGAVGDDAFGAMLKDAFADAGVDATHLATRTASAARTGCASVIVDARGENQICVGVGANATVNAKEQLGGVGAGKMLRPGDVFLTQLEVPAREVWDAIAIAKEAGLTVVLNAAPAAAVPAEVLKQARDTRRLLDRELVHVIEYIRIESTPDPIVVSSSTRRRSTSWSSTSTRRRAWRRSPSRPDARTRRRCADVWIRRSRRRGRSRGSTASSWSSPWARTAPRWRFRSS